MSARISVEITGMEELTAHHGLVGVMNHAPTVHKFITTWGIGTWVDARLAPTKE
jgi:hypothetical protein